MEAISLPVAWATQAPQAYLEAYRGPVRSRWQTATQTDGQLSFRQHSSWHTTMRTDGALPLAVSRRSLTASRQRRKMQALASVEPSDQKRPVVILPGLGNNSGDYTELVGLLVARGLPTTVAQVSRPDWLRNALGLLQGEYWAGTLKPRPVLDWYLQRIASAIEEAKSVSADGRVSLLGHSAGGWLARVFMAEFGTESVGALVTLGTPHLAPPVGSGVLDQTRGLLYHVNGVSPGAFHAPEVRYVTVASRFIRGAPVFGPGQALSTGMGTLAATPEATGISTPVTLGGEKPTLQARVIGQGYKQVCGEAQVWGDGVVPEVSAHLDGALNITLDGLYHSPVGSDDIERPWYGSPSALEAWVHHL